MSQLQRIEGSFVSLSLRRMKYRPSSAKEFLLLSSLVWSAAKKDQSDMSSRELKTYHSDEMRARHKSNQGTSYLISGVEENELREKSVSNLILISGVVLGDLGKLCCSNIKTGNAWLIPLYPQNVPCASPSLSGSWLCVKFPSCSNPIEP